MWTKTARGLGRHAAAAGRPGPARAGPAGAAARAATVPTPRDEGSRPGAADRGRRRHAARRQLRVRRGGAHRRLRLLRLHRHRRRAGTGGRTARRPGAWPAGRQPVPAGDRTSDRRPGRAEHPAGSGDRTAARTWAVPRIPTQATGDREVGGPAARPGRLGSRADRTSNRCRTGSGAPVPPAPPAETAQVRHRVAVPTAAVAVGTGGTGGSGTAGPARAAPARAGPARAAGPTRAAAPNRAAAGRIRRRYGTWRRRRRRWRRRGRHRPFAPVEPVVDHVVEAGSGAVDNTVTTVHDAVHDSAEVVGAVGETVDRRDRRGGGEATDGRLLPRVRSRRRHRRGWRADRGHHRRGARDVAAGRVTEGAARSSQRQHRRDSRKAASTADDALTGVGGVADELTETTEEAGDDATTVLKKTTGTVSHVAENGTRIVTDLLGDEESQPESSPTMTRRRTADSRSEKSESREVRAERNPTQKSGRGQQRLGTGAGVDSPEKSVAAGWPRRRSGPDRERDQRARRNIRRGTGRARHHAGSRAVVTSLRSR